ncbi:MAG: hypothetical protein HY698_04605 [Deltaproteobacteria bacterium]|nr:hypothetical protein [Deltaproteobacteria bacterium]
MANPLRLARISAVLALLGVLLMVSSILVPRPIPVVLAMTVGQAVGTLSLLIYLAAVFLESRRPPAPARDGAPARPRGAT